ncbi:MAG: PilZ domain-containing protein [Phycisphaerae bacterium]
MDSYPPDILANVRPSEDVNPRIAIGPDTLASLYKRRGEPGRVFEGRGSARIQSDIALMIMVDDEEEICVEAIDLSAAGIGFTAGRPIEPGSVITVHFESLPGKPISLCIVRNCSPVEDQYYRIGAEFKNISNE